MDHSSGGININDDRRMVVGVDDKGNFTNPQAPRLLTKWIKEHYSGPWATWSEFPMSLKNEIWSKFKETFRWPNVLDSSMEVTFARNCGRRVSSMLNLAREKAKRNTLGATWMGDVEGHNPHYISAEDWKKLIEDKWSNDNWENKSSIARSNRGEGEVHKHTGGSVPFSVTRIRLEDEKKEKISDLDLFEHTHKRRHGDKKGDFVDEKSKSTSERYKSYIKNKYGDNTASQQSLDIDVDSWIAATGEPKKKCFYGLTKQQRCTLSSSFSSSYVMNLQNENSELHETVNNLRNDCKQLSERQESMEGLMREMLATLREKGGESQNTSENPPNS